MRIAIISNLSNGIGLQRDYELLRAYLEELGHEVTGIQYDAPALDAPTFDLAISLETIERKLFHLAPVHYLFPNPEWTRSFDLDTIGGQFAKIFCKTREAERIFAKLFPDKTHYVGFLARDQYDTSIPRKAKCLHIGGNSSFRGTQAVVDAWRWSRNGERLQLELVIISQAYKSNDLPENVTLLERVSEEELKHLQNECAFHLYPCGTEGYGQALHESLGVGARLLVTDAPPMNEIDSAYKVPATGKTCRNLAEIHEVSALDIHRVIANTFRHSFRAGLYLDMARDEFLAGNAAFKKSFAEHIGAENPYLPADFKRKLDHLIHRVARDGRKKCIAFLGNFAAAESTENMVKWALETLGYEVDELQENTVTLAGIEFSARSADAFLWVRTPGWLHVSDEQMTRFLVNLPIPSFGIHLDKFFDIPEREALVGVHPFWKMTHLFTADGSRDADFKARGVNHHWMRPAMSEVYLHPGASREHLRCDVGFVGARAYHSEYPFRETLVAFLEETYRGRFRHVTDIRGHALNDFYQSCSVVIGDCFGGGKIPRYWSDRVSETCGRHGFLLHPEVEGLDVPLATYEPGNLSDLQVKIDWWLGHETERKAKIAECVEHVRKHDTWVTRVAQILEKVLDHERRTSVSA